MTRCVQVPVLRQVIEVPALVSATRHNKQIIGQSLAASLDRSQRFVLKRHGDTNWVFVCVGANLFTLGAWHSEMSDQEISGMDSFLIASVRGIKCVVC